MLYLLPAIPDINTVAANGFVCLAIVVSVTKAHSLTKLLVVINLNEVDIMFTKLFHSSAIVSVRYRVINDACTRINERIRKLIE